MTLKPFGPRLVIGHIGDAHSETATGLLLPADLHERRGLKKGIILELGTMACDPLEVEMTVYYREESAYELEGKIVVDAVDVVAFHETE